MLVLSLLILSAGCALAYVEYDIDEAEILFEQFINDYGKVYKNIQEKQMRFEIFKEHLHHINEGNKQHGYNVLGINHFADLSKKEFSSQYLGLTLNQNGSPCRAGRFRVSSSQQVPESFDWREKGIISRVKNQQGCGSCWAFSTVGNLESQYAKKHGNLITLAEQELVDCQDITTGGCEGSAMSTALVQLTGKGIMAEADYPYTSVEGDCKYDENKVKVNVTGCLDFSETPEEDIKNILVNYGPLSIALAAEPFMSYKGGVFKKCEADSKIDHALLLVGYGTDEATKQPYWIIKNSWGEAFGEKGYLRMIRGNKDCNVGQRELVLAQVA